MERREDVQLFFKFGYFLSPKVDGSNCIAQCTMYGRNSRFGEISQDGRRDFHRFSFRYQVTLQAFERRTNCPNSRFISWINNHRILDYLERNAHVARGTRSRRTFRVRLAEVMMMMMTTTMMALFKSGSRRRSSTFATTTFSSIRHPWNVSRTYAIYELDNYRFQEVEVFSFLGPQLARRLPPSSLIITFIIATGK